MMKSHVWFKAGVVIIYGSSIDASPHRHHAIQLAAVLPNPKRMSAATPSSYVLSRAAQI
ncbi:hypothetical protein [Moritella marina]|uniref:hypothetical protein n=1 Tax=Moritella marina TaxID=90736 RepID=UPI000A50E764|nr:hypothetical protein [Moritella marina]